MNAERMKGTGGPAAFSNEEDCSTKINKRRLPFLSADVKAQFQFCLFYKP
jgi:hypothetical protein